MPEEIKNIRDKLEYDLIALGMLEGIDYINYELSDYQRGKFDTLYELKNYISSFLL